MANHLHSLVKGLIPVTLFIAAAISTKAQTVSNPLAEQLGYPPNTKLLIVHADDLGVTHSVNAASIKALESGAVNSASIMVPCPWFPEIAEYAKTHPEMDFGLHLTLTSERIYIRWGPVASADKVRSLLDENSYFHHDWTPATKIDPHEVEIELRAQIERAYAMGVRPTHLDSHQYRLESTGKELFEVALRLANATLGAPHGANAISISSPAPTSANSSKTNTSRLSLGARLPTAASTSESSFFVIAFFAAQGETSESAKTALRENVRKTLHERLRLGRFGIRP